MDAKFHNKNGGFWKYLESEGAKHENQFSDAMMNVDSLGAKGMAQDGPFSKFNRIIDIGGSSGSFLRKVLNLNPKLEGVLFDRPQLLNTKAIRSFYSAGGKY